MSARDAFLRAAPAIKRIRPAYYNEHDPFAAAWLRELIADGLIPAGDVDERSITEVSADDVRPYTQCHWFAGIGGWPLALRLAGWGDDRAVWTGSPPCQPFSSAGRRRGAEDDRHLAPVWLDLVRECRPPVLFGEQVASKPVLGPSKPARRLPGATPEWAWFDDLCAHLEGSGYACGASDLPAAGVGAPHIRQRLFFGAVRVDHGSGAGREGRRGVEGQAEGREPAGAGVSGGVGESGVAGLEGHAGDGDGGGEPGRVGAVAAGPASAAGGAGGLAHSDEGQRGRLAVDGDDERDGPARGRVEGHGEPAGGGDAGRVADADGERRDGLEIHLRERGPRPAVSQAAGGGGVGERPCAPHGGWAAVDWLLCRDGKWRPALAEIFPLADGVSNRVGLLRGAGNAIVPQAAAEFIAAFEEASR